MHLHLKSCSPARRIGKCEQKAEIQRKLVHTSRNTPPSFQSEGYIFCSTKKLPKVRVYHSNPDDSSKVMDRNGRLHSKRKDHKLSNPEIIELLWYLQ